MIVIEHNDGFDFIVAHDVAKYHQGGTRRMKARPIRLSFGDKIALANAINNWIISGYDKA